MFIAVTNLIIKMIHMQFDSIILYKNGNEQDMGLYSSDPQLGILSRRNPNSRGYWISHQPHIQGRISVSKYIHIEPLKLQFQKTKNKIKVLTVLKCFAQIVTVFA